MSWQVVAKNDLRYASRSLMLWVVTGLFVLFAIFMVGSFIMLEEIFQEQADVGDITIEAMAFMISPVGLFAPIIGLLVGYKAIVGERESGSLKVLLSLPHSRFDVMLGKLVGRTLVLVMPLLLAFVVMGVALSIFVEVVAIVELLQVILLSVLFGMVFVSIAISISGSVHSSTIAGAAMFGVYVILVIVWDFLNVGLLLALEGEVFVPQQELPTWYHLVEMLAPNGAFSVAVQGLLPGRAAFGGAFPGGPPLYLTEWAAMLVLLCWLVIPFALGYKLFEMRDL